MTLVQILAKLINLYLMVLIVDPIITSNACTAKKGGVDISGVVSGDVVTCTSLNCNGAVIDGCQLVVYAGDTAACGFATIMNATDVICTTMACTMV